MKISHTKPVSLVVPIAPLVWVILVTNINGHVLHLIRIRVHIRATHIVLHDTCQHLKYGCHHHITIAVP